jgi:Ca2+-binding EF-hand superfamily protein
LPRIERTDIYQQWNRSVDGADPSNQRLAGIHINVLCCPEPDERGEIPDPMFELSSAATGKWIDISVIADRDGDGAVSHKEWPANKITAELPALAGTTFDLWDRNRDGRVQRQEAQWLIEVAYGMIELDGRPLRMPTGRVFSRYYFRQLDKNHDGVLALDEFVSGHSYGTLKNTEIFHKLDGDHDARLTEMETLRLLWHDTVGNFLSYDQNLDGYLSTDEFLAIGWGTPVARHSVRAFDEDGDGKISFREFRGTTFANQASDWPIPRRDADGDGRLSWQEFYTEKPPLLFAQGRWFFEHLDRDKGGFLSFGELEFDTNLDKVPPEALFDARDLDNDEKLVLTEVFTEQKPAGRDKRETERYEMRLAAAESRFLTDDKDSSGDLDLAEFIESQQAAMDAARRQSNVLANRQTMLEGNYWMRKGVLVVNEIVFLGIVWMVVKVARIGQAATLRRPSARNRCGIKTVSRCARHAAASGGVAARLAQHVAAL